MNPLPSFHSRNQLSSLPPYICQLPLRVLIVSNNKLGALPPDISTLGSLRQLVRMGSRGGEGLESQAPGTSRGRSEGEAGCALGVRPRLKEVVRDRRHSWSCGFFLVLSSFQDVSSNELQSLPAELCSLSSLRDLNVRRNQLSTLPEGEEDEELEVWGGEREIQTEVREKLEKGNLSQKKNA